MTPAEGLRALFAAAVASAQPARVLPAHLPPPPRGRTVVLGLGKAAAGMGAAVEAAWPESTPLSGVLIAPHGTPDPGLRRLTLCHARHPRPDAHSVAAAQALLGLTSGLSEDDLVLVLLSGGASSLATLPLPGLSLDELIAVSHQLLACGAPIDAMNTLRKHLCGLKGGRLAAACGPEVPVLTLAISDVPGDALDRIGSGPSVADPSTCADALAVAARWGVALPAAAEAALRSGVWESIKRLPAHHRAEVVASPALALAAAAQRARRLGWDVRLGSDRLEGEARGLGAQLAREALATEVGRPTVFLSGGEATVSLGEAAPGQGGRAAETLLAAALEAEGRALHGLMADTDGIDGTGPAAGAHFAPDSLTLARQWGDAPEAALAAHDAGGFWARQGLALATGPTGTNVNDFRALLRWPSAADQ
jgi:hydroxypyruvate reductase